MKSKDDKNCNIIDYEDERFNRKGEIIVELEARDLKKIKSLQKNLKSRHGIEMSVDELVASVMNHGLTRIVNKLGGVEEVIKWICAARTLKGRMLNFLKGWTFSIKRI